jgi:protein-tyrosine phosphatase
VIDLHCHILPNVDDGATSLQESLQMARFCVKDGISVIAATPHCHRYIHLLRNDILPRVAQLNSDLESAKIPLKIVPGSEIQVIDTLQYRREFEEGVFCHLGDGRSFTLLEFNWSYDLFPPDAVDIIEWINRQGMKPIVAHPERHDYFVKDPELVQKLVDAGAWLQITADSLLGNHGPNAKIFGEVFLKRFPEVILATDAHNMKRCSGLSPGYEWVEKHLGQERAADLRARADQVKTSVLATSETNG